MTSVGASMGGNYVLNNTRHESTKLTGTFATTVVTGTERTKPIGLIIANVDGSVDVHATITWTDDSAAVTYTLLHQHDVPVNGTLYFPLDGFDLDTDDVIQVTAESANDLHVTAIIAELPGRSG